MLKSGVFGRSSVSQVIMKNSYFYLSLFCLLKLFDIVKSLKSVPLFKYADIFNFQ